MLENLQYWVNSTMTTASGSSWDFIHEPEHLLYDYLLLFSIACLNFFFFSRFFFNLDHFFKVFIKFVMILLLFFMFRCFGHKAYSILVPRPEIKPHGHDWATITHNHQKVMKDKVILKNYSQLKNKRYGN